MADHDASERTAQAYIRRRGASRQMLVLLLTLITYAGSLAVLGCSDDDDDDGEELGAELTGGQEVPPVNTAATGTVTLNVSDDRTRIDYRVQTEPPFTSDVRVAHIHIGQPGVNGPVVLFFCSNTTPPETPAGVPVPQACPTTGGTITGSLTAADLIPRPEVGVSTFADAVGQILNGNSYSNVHTILFPGGEIRGQNLRE
jgi:CHRD domain